MTPRPETQRDAFLVAQIAVAISVVSFFYCLQHSYLLLYGDAVAHINIARRVFDSRTPGPLQLGTVWLPLPHLLMLPFVISRKMWQTGIGASIPSLFAYVLSVVGIFRLVETVLSASDVRFTRFASWLAAGIFALNPNLIYLQTTAMTEAIYLCLFVWTMVFFVESLRSCTGAEKPSTRHSLTKSGVCLLGTCLTRYDGWLLAAVLVVLILVLAYFGRFTTLRSAAWKFFAFAAAGPVLWLAYNAAVYRNPLEFADGPYSAKAIELKSLSPGTPPHPGTQSLPLAFQYFFKSAELNLAQSHWQLFWVTGLLLGTAIVVLFQRRLWPVLLLWIPVPFYMLSIAYGGVPIFIPTWWPFSYYNTRYGIELLPAFAVLTAIAAYGLMRFVAEKKVRTAIAILFVGFAAASYAGILHSVPVVFKEAVVNSRSRIALEEQLASILATLPSDETFLMYLGDHVGVFQRAGIPISRVINEGNHRPWKQPNDPDGLWEKALAEPASYVQIVIALDGDPVATSVNKAELASVMVLHVTGQPQATIYRTIKSNQTR